MDNKQKKRAARACAQGRKVCPGCDWQYLCGKRSPQSLKDLLEKIDPGHNIAVFGLEPLKK